MCVCLEWVYGYFVCWSTFNHLWLMENFVVIWKINCDNMQWGQGFVEVDVCIFNYELS